MCNIQVQPCLSIYVRTSVVLGLCCPHNLTDIGFFSNCAAYLAFDPHCFNFQINSNSNVSNEVTQISNGQTDMLTIHTKL